MDEAGQGTVDRRSLVGGHIYSPHHTPRSSLTPSPPLPTPSPCAPCTPCTLHTHTHPVIRKEYASNKGAGGGGPSAFASALGMFRAAKPKPAAGTPGAAGMAALCCLHSFEPCANAAVYSASACRQGTIYWVPAGRCNSRSAQTARSPFPLLRSCAPGGTKASVSKPGVDIPGGSAGGGGGASPAEDPLPNAPRTVVCVFLKRSVHPPTHAWRHRRPARALFPKEWRVEPCTHGIRDTAPPPSHTHPPASWVHAYARAHAHSSRLPFSWLRIPFPSWMCG